MVTKTLALASPLLYGTAWKEENTAACVTQALEAGFKAFDTANQRRHYFEAEVGRAIQEAIAQGQVRRDALFLQTKFTYRSSQDHRLPYDPAADMATQVRQSFEQSLKHFGTSQIDSFVLHGPQTPYGLTQNDYTVWRVMEELSSEAKVKALGLSNVSASQIKDFCKMAGVTPTFVQNRCYPSIAWDLAARDVCRDYGITYQAFSLIRDPIVLHSGHVAAIAGRHGRTVPQVVYRWASQLGMWPMIGTTSAAHMAEALRIVEFELDPGELAAIGHLGRA